MQGQPAVGPYVESLLLLAGTMLALAMGLYIVFQAYRGYRRNESRRMLFLAIGLTLVTVAPFALSILATGLGQQVGLPQRTYTFYLPLGSRLLEITGLSCIIYSLHDRS